MRREPSWEGRPSLPDEIYLRGEEGAEAGGEGARADARGLVHEAVAREPGLELGRRAAAEQVAHGEGVVERGALVAQHDVVGAGHAHHEVDARGGEQGQQRVHVVLVGLGMIGVAGVAAHRQAHELAAEMILEPGANDLLPVVEIFRPDEAHHGVDQERPERPRHRVGARLERLLVDAVMGLRGEGAPLPGLEIHHVVADRAARERQRGGVGFGKEREIDAEALVGGLRAGDRLEHEIDRRIPGDERERGGDMRQHAALRRDVELDAHVLEHRQERMGALGTVGRGVDADDGVARAEQEAVENARRDAGEIVGGVIGLQPHREAAGEPDGVAEAGDDRAFRRHHHQILQAADLAHRRRHLGRDARRERGKGFGRRRIGEKPVAQAAHRQMGNGRERARVVGVDDEAGDLVAFVGHHLLIEERAQRRSASATCAATRSSPEAAAIPPACRRCAAGWPWP